MAKQNKKTQKNTKKYVIIGIITAVLLVLIGVGLYLYNNHSKNQDVSQATYPLGDGLEYIGKNDYGCVGFCDSNPGSNYFYGTDMTPQEVVKYFSKARLDKPEDLLTKNDPITFVLYASNNSNPIYVDYYTDGLSYTRGFDLIKTDLKHLIVISGEDYEAAKASL